MDKKYKICKHCEEKKEVHEFPKHQFPRIGHRDKCKSCCGMKVQRKDKELRRWVSNTFSGLGLTGADY